MKLIIAGTRTFNDYTLMMRTLDPFVDVVSEVVSGGATGADAWGEHWAKQCEKRIRRFPADWNRYGRRAGPVRNQQMVDYADALIAFWDGESRGTASIIEMGLAKFPKRVKVVYYGT